MSKNKTKGEKGIIPKGIIKRGREVARGVLRKIIPMYQSDKERFGNYGYRIVWPSSEPLNPYNEAVEVRLKGQEGAEYSADFVTRAFLDEMFAKNAKTGECANGTYFAMPRMIIASRIDDESVKQTIEDMINNDEVLEYFRPLRK